MARQDMRARAHRRWLRVPAVNKSTLVAGSALLPLASGMESKRSGRTCTPECRDISAKHFDETVRMLTHGSQVQPKKAPLCVHISLRNPVAERSKRGEGDRQGQSEKMLVYRNKGAGS